MEAKDVGGGRCFINMRFRNRKVLIVLDDVDQLNQLESLAGSPNWFGEGSRIIITTKDKHLLKAHKVVVHDISLLHCDKAIELFSKHAFSEGYIQTKDHEQLVKEVVYYAGGLPLALTLLGSSLCDREIHQWRSAIAGLKEIPDDKIVDKLKVSFDGLTKVQKDLFLDIAYFFRRKKKDRAMEIFDACSFHPVAGHLVQEMGHYVVREEHPKNLEKHTRVWREEDIRTICDMEATKYLDNIEAIQVDYYRFQPIPPIGSKIKNLQYVQWKGDAANALLSNAPPRRLCYLIFSKSNQNQLWSGNKSLRNLKMMELHELHKLITIPTFDGLRYLERFQLSKCPQLEEIHSSFGGLDRLVCLTIDECSGITRFPSITRLKKLETLSFARCPRLFSLFEIQQKIENFVDEEISSAVRELSKLNPDIRLCFFRIDLRNLDLRNCNLGDENINSVVWPRLMNNIVPIPPNEPKSRTYHRVNNLLLVCTPRIRIHPIKNLLRTLKSRRRKMKPTKHQNPKRMSNRTSTEQMINGLPRLPTNGAYNRPYLQPFTRKRHPSRNTRKKQTPYKNVDLFWHRGQPPITRPRRKHKIINFPSRLSHRKQPRGTNRPTPSITSICEINVLQQPKQSLKMR
ncbi:hypothetical protein LXL04_021503 [Taraxacum kok-saghyz]